MDNGLFRKKSLDKVASPEQMSDYIRVTHPGVWLPLGAIALLLAGLILWAAVGRLETTVTLAASTGPDGVVCYVPEEDAEKLAAGMTVRIAGGEYALGELPPRPVEVDGSMDAYLLHIGGLGPGQWVYPVRVNASIDEGVYEAKIVTGSVAPLSFLLN